MKYDRDTIIDALEHCTRLDDDNFPMPTCIECPVVIDCMRCYVRIPYEMKEPLLELLKEQKESIPISWLKEKLDGHPELPYAVTDGIINVLDLWEGR